VATINSSIAAAVAREIPVVFTRIGLPGPSVAAIAATDTNHNSRFDDGGGGGSGRDIGGDGGGTGGDGAVVGFHSMRSRHKLLAQLQDVGLLDPGNPASGFLNTLDIPSSAVEILRPRLGIFQGTVSRAALSIYHSTAVSRNVQIH
jgi:hypothetical protein